MDKKLDTLIKLSEACWTEFDTRRSYEWKISFGLWTAIGIIIGFALKEDVNHVIDMWLVTLVLVIIMAAYIWWHIGLRNSNKRDQDKRHAYFKVIHKEIDFWPDLNKITDDSLEEDWKNRNLNLTERTKNNKKENAKQEISELFHKRPSTSSGFFLSVWSHGFQVLITVILLILLWVVLWNKVY
jgi:hypothetical protein